MNASNTDARMKSGVGYLTKEYTLVNTPEVKEVKNGGDGGEKPDLSLKGLIKSYNGGSAIPITPEFYEKFKGVLDSSGYKVGDTIQKGGSN